MCGLWSESHMKGFFWYVRNAKLNIGKRWRILNWKKNTYFWVSWVFEDIPKLYRWWFQDVYFWDLTCLLGEMISVFDVSVPGNSAGDLFGMVSSRDLVKGWNRDHQRSGIKRSQLESPPVRVFFCFQVILLNLEITQLLVVSVLHVLSIQLLIGLGSSHGSKHFGEGFSVSEFSPVLKDVCFHVFFK